MSAKLNKVNAEIEKYEQKRLQIDNKIKSLYKERKDLEHLEMIDMLKKNNTSLSDLQGLLENLNKQHGDVIPMTMEVETNETD
ncbi:DUF4315 family protein [Chakrabartyella piscis]|uniref:DUF4315 family protein n=1 Tax=Chakrabartyella piscis TaxID=2918914 RepID=UPI0029586ACE|nr:DUF4315 family protein [Chakrabartyella piscis]